jgi:hypothetical protein
MGYNLYITKAKTRAASQENPIKKKELSMVIAQLSDPNLEFRDGKRLVWFDTIGDERCRMILHNGHLVSKNPPPEFIEKFKTIAQLLSATVQGDNGEIYK